MLRRADRVAAVDADAEALGDALVELGGQVALAAVPGVRIVRLLLEAEGGERGLVSDARVVDGQVTGKTGAPAMA